MNPIRHLIVFPSSGLGRAMRHSLLAISCLTMLSACLPEEGAVTEADPAILSGKVWVVEDIENKGVIDNSHQTLIFSDGRISGDTNCNRLMGSYVAGAPDKMALDPVATTRRACTVEALADQEQRYLAALAKVTHWQIKNGLLFLNDDAGETVLRFWAEDPSAVKSDNENPKE